MPSRAYYQAHKERLAAQARLRYYKTRGYVEAQDLRTRDPETGRFETSDFDPDSVGKRLKRADSGEPREALFEPIPVFDPHPLVDDAMKHLKGWELSDLDRDMDTIARDLIGEYVLASLEGKDPLTALLAARSKYQHDRRVLIHGAMITSDLYR